MNFYIVSDKNLIAIADAIREKSGEEKLLTFPEDFIQEIRKLKNDSREIVNIIKVPLEDIKAQEKIIDPSVITQIITPDDGYNYLSQVIIKAIDYKEISNSAGGVTAIIAGDGYNGD